MPVKLSSLALTALAWAGSILQATDFLPLIHRTQNDWPGKRHIGVVCNYEFSKAEVAALAEAAPDGTNITVINIFSITNISFAKSLVSKVKPDFIVILPNDRIVRPGTVNALLLKRDMANLGIPVVETSR